MQAANSDANLGETLNQEAPSEATAEEATSLPGSGKIKKRVTFYMYNRETKVEEVKLLSVAAGLVGVSTEDFIRGCALERAARIVIVEQRRQQKEQAAESADATSASSDASGATQQEKKDGVESQGEVEPQAEALAAASGGATPGAAVEST